MNLPQPTMNEDFRYELRLEKTSASRGFFGCVPAEDLDLDAAFWYLRSHPMDDFMHLYLLERIRILDIAAFERLVDTCPPEPSAGRGLLYTAALLFPKFSKKTNKFTNDIVRRLIGYSPLVYIKSDRIPDQPLHRKWSRLFSQNIFDHQPLPPPEKAGLSFLYTEKESKALNPPISLPELAAVRPDTVSGNAYTAEEVAETAERRLSALGILDGEEMRHESSLSPCALLRAWQMQATVRIGSHRYRLSGKQTAYGKGLSWEGARASCRMEVVERCSAFASFADDRVLGYREPHRLVHSSYSDLAANGISALNPNDLRLEVPYSDEPLYWISGCLQRNGAGEDCLVPVQCVFLFCNLDEISLFSSLGSTGLASGMTEADARLHALLEVIERDCEAITPYHPASCFTIETTDPTLSRLFEMYRNQGIHILFQDLTAAMGIPCCKAFVKAGDGSVAMGSGAHLNARSALVSALTEVPFPFPNGPSSAPAESKHLIRVPLENLPDYSTGTPEQDLQLLETLLHKNGYHPIYVNLTRTDLDLPVVRAIVPGMEILADFDHTARISPRLFANYRSLFLDSH